MNKKPALQNFEIGDTILKQGDEGNSAYIIESGSVEILIEKENGLIQSLGTRGAGSIIGEMALVDSKPRTATIKVTEKCKLLEITRDDFDTRIGATDPVVQMIMQVILARYRDMMTRAHIFGHAKEFPTPEDLERGLVAGTNAVSELKLISDLKLALTNDDLELHYQPIIDIQNNHIVGFEALVRWNHAEKGMIYPDTFIRIAEDSGLITELTRWVVKQSCAMLSRIVTQYKNTSPAPLFMSVNFSSKDFLEPDFKNYILSNLKENNLKPQQFHIEITERLLIDQPTEAREILEECRNAGMIISIDDFGTGYSSLSYLHYFPIDILKIDRRFIINIDKDMSCRKLVESIISLGHNIGMSIIAEGIEDAKQAQTLLEMGCDKTQGYFYARPMPESQLAEYLSQNL